MHRGNSRISELDERYLRIHSESLLASRYALTLTFVPQTRYSDVMLTGATCIMEPHVREKQLLDREKELRQQFEGNKIQFLLTEVDTATTFCHVANTSDDPDKKKRNIANACEGYNTILKFQPGARFDPASKGEFDYKMAHLQALLRELGQHVPTEGPVEQ